MKRTSETAITSSNHFEKTRWVKTEERCVGRVMEAGRWNQPQDCIQIDYGPHRQPKNTKVDYETMK